MNALKIKELIGINQELSDLQKVFEESPGYFTLVNGALPRPTEAQSQVTILPPGKNFDDKFVFGFFNNGSMIGCADIIRGHPDENIATIGLFLINEPNRKKGYGKYFFSKVEEKLRSWSKIQKIHITVTDTNSQVAPFLAKLGFDQKPAGNPGNGGENRDLRVYEKKLNGS